ncbi:hypothetical protein AGLY_010130 [Aphis glycines]|uniref:Uncharacterized protein n=1 Tax=Aphis glycines TaxID=307491 RepID=A0A6G0TG05_APHGL|nr:hypothetical protein AGLY_010130 [Aphis glycines]
MTSSIAVQVSVFVVLALLRPRSTLASPHGDLPSYDHYATNDGVSNVTAADHDVRMDHARHSYGKHYSQLSSQWFKFAIKDTNNKPRWFIRIHCLIEDKNILFKYKYKRNNGGYTLSSSPLVAIRFILYGTYITRHFQGFNGRVQKGCLKTKHTYNIMLLLWMLLLFVVYTYGNTSEISTPFGGWHKLYNLNSILLVLEYSFKTCGLINKGLGNSGNISIKDSKSCTMAVLHDSNQGNKKNGFEVPTILSNEVLFNSTMSNINYLRNQKWIRLRSLKSLCFLGVLNLYTNHIQLCITVKRKDLNTPLIISISHLHRRYKTALTLIHC